MTEYIVSDKLRDIVKNENHTVAIQTEVTGQLEHAIEALQGIEVSPEKKFVGNEDSYYSSVVVYGNNFFTPYERGYRDLSADDYMTFDEAFDEAIPGVEEPMTIHYISQEQLDFLDSTKRLPYPATDFSTSSSGYRRLFGDQKYDSDFERDLLRYLGGDGTITFLVKEEQLYRLTRVDLANDTRYMRIDEGGTPSNTLAKSRAFTAPLEEIEKWKAPAWSVEPVEQEGGITMSKYRVSEQVWSAIDAERTVAIEVDTSERLEAAKGALADKGIYIKENAVVYPADEVTNSIVVYGTDYFITYPARYQELSARRHSHFYTAFVKYDESIPADEPCEEPDGLVETSPESSEMKPEPGVKYLWESPRNDRGEGNVVLFMHKEEGVMGMGISGLRWYETLEQAQDAPDTHLTVEELEEQGYNPDKFIFRPLKKEPERFIWVSKEPVPHVLKRSENQGSIWFETYHTDSAGRYQEYTPFHLTEAEVDDSMYDTRKFTKKPVAGPVEEPKVTYKFTDKANKLRGKEPFVIYVDNKEQADILTSLTEVGSPYVGGYDIVLYLYRKPELTPDFLAFREQAVPRLSFEEAVEVVTDEQAEEPKVTYKFTALFNELRRSNKPFTIDFDNPEQADTLASMTKIGLPYTDQSVELYFHRRIDLTPDFVRIRHNNLTNLSFEDAVEVVTDEPKEEPKVTYKFTDRVNELRGKEPFTIDVGYRAQADTLVDLLGGRNKVDGKYEEGIVELYFYREMALNPDFLNFVSDEVTNLSFEEAVEVVTE